MFIFSKNIDFGDLKPIPNDFSGYFTYGNDMLQSISIIVSFPNFHSHRAQNDIFQFLKQL